MMSGKQVIQSRFGPSYRILELAQHKTSKTVWATTPCEKLKWGNQAPIWPLSSAALTTSPSARIQYLSRHKRDFSAREDQRRKEEEEEERGEEQVCFFRKTLHPSFRVSQYENIVRLSTPKTRSYSTHDQGPPHSPQCEKNCPIWHVEPRVKTDVITLRLLQLSNPKLKPQDWQRNKQSPTSGVSLASQSAQVSKRIAQLSLPRLKESNICVAYGRPEEPIWSVSRGAKKAKASARVEMLASPKELSQKYIPPRDPQWRRKHILYH